MTEDAARFGALLGACRRSAGLSQEELAKRAGLSVRAVGDIERGRVLVPHPGTVHRLAGALELPEPDRKVFLAAAGRRLAGTGALTVPRQRILPAGVLRRRNWPGWSARCRMQVAQR